MNIIIHTDGGARGNPGPAAIGVVIEELTSDKQEVISKTKKVAEFGKRIGETTNNVAEYTAVIEALRFLKSQDKNCKDQQKIQRKINFFLDSTLVVNQLNGMYKIKEPHLRNLFMEIKMLEQEVRGVSHYTYVPREQNRRADFLVNQALDQFLMSS